LIAKGASQRPGASTEPSQLALERLHEDLALLWDGVVRGVVHDALKTSSRDDLAQLPEALRVALAASRGRPGCPVSGLS